MRSPFHRTHFRFGNRNVDMDGDTSVPLWCSRACDGWISSIFQVRPRGCRARAQLTDASGRLVEYLLEYPSPP